MTFLRGREFGRGPRAAAAVLAAAGVVGGGVAAASAGEDHDAPTHQVIAGSAVNQYPTPAGPGSARLTVAARSGPGGKNPGGFVTAKGTAGAPMSEFSVGGGVTCIRVDGNRTSIKYRFDRATGSAALLAGGGVEVFIEDNGAPANGSPVDRDAFTAPQMAGVFDRAATQCDDPNVAAYDTVESGDYNVRVRAHDRHGRHGHRRAHSRSRHARR